MGERETLEVGVEVVSPHTNYMAETHLERRKDKGQNYNMNLESISDHPQIATLVMKLLSTS